MAELIYSIRNIFSNTSQDDCLFQNGNADKYHIAAYQRGYKWGSDAKGATSILLNDLWEAFIAFEKQERKEYYLQYITLKRNNDKNHLEVIDGQQRLTTLSLILSIFSCKQDTYNLAKGKLHYAIRSNFFDEYIYQKEALKALFENEWIDKEGLKIGGKPYNNSQDVFYLFSAVKKINQFLDQCTGKNDAFSKFILDHVKIIVNVVEPHLASEKVFSNLNSKKVPLTEAELIKGLLLTKISRKASTDEGKKHFKEILELRMSLGRHWDEMARWSNNPFIKSYFFQDNEGMESLLRLVALELSRKSKEVKLDEKAISKDYPLFNFYHRSPDLEKVYQCLKDFQATLNDWFNDSEIYNLIGFCRFAKDSKSNDLKFLLECLPKSKSELKSHLHKKAIDLLSFDIDKIFYGERNDDIHRILLAINVFPEEKQKQIRFNFHDYVQEKWSLEHIFPQTPEGKGKKLSEQHKEQVLSMLGDKATDEMRDVLKLPERTEEQRGIYEKALKETKSLNSMGNMCLLTSPDNSSNGNDFFDDKTTNILCLIREGSFVPKHTFDVFSKMVLINRTDLTIWSMPNINEHLDYLQNRVNDIFKKFTEI